MKHKYSDRIDWSFKYVKADYSDVSKTFARVRRELAEKPVNVTPIRKEKRA